MDVEFHDVHVERDHRRVLDISSLRLRSGRTTAILGPNGSGKTTLLRLIAGLEHPRAGRVRFVGSVNRSVRLEPDLSRPSIAYVFQEEVFLRRSVRENLELGLRLRGVPIPETQARVDDAAARLGISHLMHRRADHLSGGEGRRVNLARALALRSSLVLLDEPLEGLDEPTHSRLLDELPRLLAEFDATTLLVTHNRDEALRLAQDLVVLIDGRVRAAGDKRQVAMNPTVVEVAEVLGYAVLASNGHRVAVPPGGLRPGAGPIEFSLIVEDVLDIVESYEVVGYVGDVRVHVGLPFMSAIPRRGERIVVHATRFCELP